MKKLLTLLLALIMMFTVVACDQVPPSADKDNNNSSSDNDNKAPESDKDDNSQASKSDKDDKKESNRKEESANRTDKETVKTDSAVSTAKPSDKVAESDIEPEKDALVLEDIIEGTWVCELDMTDGVNKNIEVICLVFCHLVSSAFPQIFLLNIPGKT